MSDIRQYQMVSITGYDLTSGILHCVDLQSGESLSVTASHNAYNSGFVFAMGDNTAKTYTPPSSIVLLGGVASPSPGQPNYLARFASPISKNIALKDTYLAGVKIDANAQVLNGKPCLFANTLDADFEPVRQIQDIKDAMMRALKGDNGRLEKAVSRGVLIRIGYQKSPTEKHVLSYEVYARANESASVALQRTSKELPWFQNMLRSAQHVLKETNGILEVTGFSRSAINIYGNPKIAQQLANRKEYIEVIEGKNVNAYALTAISVDKKTGLLDKLVPVNKAPIRASVSGLVGRHDNDVSLPFQIKFDETLAQNNRNIQTTSKPVSKPSEYLLTISEKPNASGKRVNFKVSGTNKSLSDYQSRIENAAPGIVPFKLPNESAYIFPSTSKNEVLSNLSDLTGAPAIYSKGQVGENGAHFKIAGHIEKTPFHETITQLIKEYDGRTINNEVFFLESDRVRIEARIGSLIGRPLQPAVPNAVNLVPATASARTRKSNSFPQRLSYAQWMQETFNNSPNELMRALYSDIHATANLAGIDWSATVDNIIIPSPLAKQELFKGSKIVYPIESAHKGSVAVIANSYMNEVTSTKGGPSNGEAVAFSITFINKKLQSGECQEKFHSASYTWQLYRDALGSGRSTTKSKIDNTAQIREREEKRQAKLALKAESDRKESMAARQDALLIWGSGTEETGTHAQLVAKGIAPIVDVVSLRTVQGRNPYYMYQIVDLYDNFLGIQKIHTTPWTDKKGKKTNKVYSKGMVFTDPDRQLKLGAHQKVGRYEANKPIYVVEGFSDAASGHLATGSLFVNALDKNNKPYVIAGLKKVYPSARIIDVADNDINNARGNVGVLSTLHTSWSQDIEYVVPKSIDSANADINEVYLAGGEVAVQALLHDIQSVPKNIVEYYRLRLSHVAHSSLEGEIQTAKNDIFSVYPNLSDEQINIALDTSTLIQFPQPPESTNRVNVINTPSSLPIVIKTLENQKTKKPYLAIYDNTSSGLSIEIESALSKILSTNKPLFNDYVGAYIAPNGIKNLLSSMLYKFTGAPRLYIGLPIGDSEGFVVRGNIDEPLLARLEQSLSSISHRLSKQEQGLVVDELVAIHLIKEKFEQELLPQHVQFDLESVTNQSAQVVSKSENNLSKASAEFDVSSIEIAKAHALILANEGNVVRDNFFTAAAVAKIIANRPKNDDQPQSSQQRYESIIVDAVHLTSSSIFGANREVLEKGKLVHALGIKYGVEFPVHKEDITDRANVDVEESVDQTIPKLSGKELSNYLPNTSIEVELRSDNTDADKRIAELIEHIDLFVDHGYTFDEFFNEGHELAGSPYFDKDQQKLDTELLNKDLLAISKDEVTSWPFSEKPRTIAAVFNCCYKRTSALRLEHLNDFIANYLHTHGATGYATFVKYFKGLKQSSVMSVPNPYMRGNELETDLFEADCDHHFEQHTQIGDIYRSQVERLDAVSNESSKQAQLGQSITQTTLPKNVTEIPIKNQDPIFVMSDTNANLVFSKQLAINKDGVFTNILGSAQIAHRDVEQDQLTLSKLNDNNGFMFVVSQRNELKASHHYFPEYMTAKATFERLFTSLNPDIATTQQNTIVTFPTKSEKDISPAQDIKGNISTTDTKKAFNALSLMIKEAVKNELFYSDFYADYFKPDGIFFNSNPFLVSDSQKLDTKSLKEALASNGYINLSDAYETHYRSIHRLTSAEHLKERIGGFIPLHEFDRKMSLHITFENFKNVVSIGIQTAPSKLLPFKQYLDTSEAFSPIHPILAQDPGTISEWFADSGFTRSELLLLADIHQVVEIDINGELPTMLEQIEQTWKSRRLLTFMLPEDIGSMEHEELREYCSIVNAEFCSNKSVTANRIVSKIEQMRETSHVRIAQYNYIRDALLLEQNDRIIPSYAITDIAKFNIAVDKDMLQLGRAYESELNMLDSLGALAGVIPKLSIPEMEDRKIHNKAEFEDAFIVGIKDPKYVTRGKYHYISRSASVEALSLPDEITYFTVLDDLVIGLPTPLENAYLVDNSLSPINNNALKKAVAPFTKHIEQFGSLCFNADDHNIVISKQESGFTQRTFDSASVTVEIIHSTDIYDLLLNTLDRIADITDHHKLEELMATNQPLNDSLLAIDSIEKRLSNSEDNSELLRTFSETHNEYETADVRFTAQSLFAYLGDYRKTVELQLEKELQTGDTKTQSNPNAASLVVSEAYSKVVGLMTQNHIDIEEKQKETVETLELEYESYASSSMEPVSKPPKPMNMFDILHPQQTKPIDNVESPKLGDFAFVKTEKSYAGVISAFKDDLIAIKPLWSSKLDALPERERSKYIDPLSKTPYFLMSINEFMDTRAAKANVFDVLDLSLPWEDNEKRLNNGSLREINMLAKILGANIKENVDDTLSQIGQELEVRKQLVGINNGGENSLKSDIQALIQSKMSQYNTTTYQGLLTTLNSNSTKEIAIVNLDKALITASEALGDISSHHSYKETYFENADIQIVSGLDILSSITNATVLELTNADNIGAEFVKAAFLQKSVMYADDILNQIKIKILNDKHWFEVIGHDSQFPTLGLAETYITQTDQAPLFQRGEEVLFTFDNAVSVGLVLEDTLDTDEQIALSINNKTTSVNLADTQIADYQPTDIEQLRKVMESELSGSYDEVIDELQNKAQDAINMGNLPAARASLELSAQLTMYNDAIQALEQHHEVHIHLGKYSTTHSKEHTYGSFDSLITALANANKENTNATDLSAENKRPPGTVLSEEARRTQGEQSTSAIPRTPSNSSGQADRGELGIVGKQDSIDSELRGSSKSADVSSSRSNRNVVETHTAQRITDFRYPSDYINSEDWSTLNRVKMNIDAIKLVKVLDNNELTATASQKTTLSKYSGWGGLSAAFSSDHRYYPMRHELANLVTKQEFEAMKSSTLTSFYTPPKLMQVIWAASIQLGFRGGKALDPSTGIGGFMGAIPNSISTDTKFTAIELDVLTAKIAKHLYSEPALKNQGFEKTRLPNDYFDLAISNIPFGNYSVFDSEYATKSHKIHDYFFIKTLDKVAPGQLLSFITSTGTLDKHDSAAREDMYKKADLVAAIRLPSKMFAQFAGTDVSTDIVFFRKRFSDEEPQSSSWLQSVPIDIEDTSGNLIDHSISQYFVNNPHMIVGQQISVSGQYGPTIRVKSPEDVYDTLNALVLALPKDIIHQKSPQAPVTTQAPLKDVAQSNIKPDSFVLVDGILNVAIQKWDSERDDYRLVSELANIAKSKINRTVGLVTLRDKVRDHITLQIEDPDNEHAFQRNMAELNLAYDGFVRKYGFVNSRENKSVFKTDPDAPLLLGLERSSNEQGVYQKTDIFAKRTISHVKTPENIDSANDALMFVVAQTGAVNTDMITELTGRDWSNVRQELGDQVYLDPSNMTYVLKEHYLSGNIKEKLDMAKSSQEIDDRFVSNIEALKAVMPRPIPLADIKVRLGSTWVPSPLVADFAYYIVSGVKEPDNQKDVTATHSPAGWAVHAQHLFKHRNAGRCEVEFGTKRLDAIELINRVLNGSEIVLKEKTEDGKTYVNVEATAEANDKAKRIGDEFKQWIFSAPDRGAQLASAYNERYNVFVEARYDGSQINYTGLSPFLNGQEFIPRDTQKNALMRFLVDRSVLLAHQVGTGKSFELVSMCIEGKARGVVNKPMLAVPNNVFGQLGRLARQHYPNANIIMLDPRGMNKEKRRNLIAQVAFNDWDMVLVPHSILNMIAAPDKFASRLMRGQISELESHLSNDDSGVMSFSNKRLERRKKSLEGKLEKLQKRDAKDTTLFIDEMGIDALMVDESDNYINVPIVSSMGHVNGVNTSESMRATNLLYLARYIQDNNDGKNIVFATGTDIRKSMTDMYANLFILAPDTLRALSVYEHDDYMSVFGEVVSSIEVSPEGTGYRENARLCKFNNLPEMAMLYRSVTDVVTSEMAGVVKPAIEPEGITIPGGEYFKAYMRDIAERSKSFRNGNKEEQWFSIMHDSKRAALDMRLVDANIPVDNGKLDVMVAKVLEIYKEPTELSRTQLVFLDGFVHATPQGFSPYDYIVSQLVAGGMPSEKIIDSRDVSSEAQKKMFEEGMDTARFSVAIGTTDKFGVGNNIQKYLYAMHEVNPPWNPRDMDQRKGRIERHGNLHKQAKIFRYVTEDSFDLFQWETMKRKASFISQSKVEPANAPREFSEDTDATYGDMMAIATGNPLFKEKMDTDAKLDNLSRAKRSHLRAQEQATHSIGFAKLQIEKNTRYCSELATAKSTLNSTNDIIINSVVTSSPTEAKELVQSLLKSELDKIESGEKPSKVIDIGTYKGIEVWLDMTGGNDGGNPSIECVIGQSDLTLSRDLRPGAIVTALGNIDAVVDAQLEKVGLRLSADKDKIEGLEQALKPYDKEDELVLLQQDASRLETAVMESVNEAVNSSATEYISWEVLMAGLESKQALTASLSKPDEDLSM